MPDLLELIFPPRCASCGQRGGWFCARCTAEVATAWRVGNRCPRCDSPVESGAGHRCAFVAPRLNGLRIAGLYAPPLRPAILAMKFEGKRRAAPPLGLVLARAWQARPGSAVDLIVTVPMPNDRLRQQGYNPAELLAATCAHELRLPLLRCAIRRTRSALRQHTLGARERQANVIGLFAADGPGAPDIAGQRVLIVDDIATTGATLNAVAQAVRDAGATAVWGLALARPMSAEYNP